MTHAERLEIAQRHRHDLGKYIWFRQRFCGPDASIAERRSAAHRDLFETRKGPAGTQTAWEVFAALPSVNDEEWERVRDRLAGLEESAPFDSADATELANVSDGCEEIARTLSAWVRRLRAEAG